MRARASARPIRPIRAGGLAARQNYGARMLAPCLPAARARGKSIGGAAVTDDAMLAVALHLRGQELSLRDIAARLVIATGKKKASTRRRRP